MLIKEGREKKKGGRKKFGELKFSVLSYWNVTVTK